MGLDVGGGGASAGGGLDRCGADRLTDVTANKRAILINCHVEVTEEYKLVADMLFLTVFYIGCFLSANPP